MLYSCEMLQLSPLPGDRLHPRGRGEQTGSRSRTFRDIPWRSRNLALKSLPDAGRSWGVHIVGAKEQCPKSNIVARRRNGYNAKAPSDGCLVGRGR